MHAAAPVCLLAFTAIDHVKWFKRWWTGSTDVCIAGSAGLVMPAGVRFNGRTHLTGPKPGLQCDADCWTVLTRVFLWAVLGKGPLRFPKTGHTRRF